MDGVKQRELDLELEVLTAAASSRELLEFAVLEGVRPEWFSDSANGAFFGGLIKNFYEPGVEPSPALLRLLQYGNPTRFSRKSGDELVAQTLIEQVITKLTTIRVITREAMARLILVLQECFHKRHLNLFVKRLSRECEGDISSKEIYRRMESFLMESVAARQGRRLAPMDHLISEFVSRLDAASSPVAESVPCGLHSVDLLVDGLSAGQVYVLAARPGMGKTSFALQCARHAARTAPVLICSLEMTSAELVNRVVASESYVDSRYLRSGALHDRARDAVARASAELSHLPIYVDDSSVQDIASIRSSVRAITASVGAPRLLVVDYLQLLRPIDSSVPREQQISALSRALKCLAKDLNLCVLLLCQLNRSAEKENRAPRLSDLRESGAVEQDADIVMFLDIDADDRKAGLRLAAGDVLRRILLVSKNRHGSTGGVPLVFVAPIQRFSDPAYEPIENWGAAVIPLPPEEESSINDLEPISPEASAPSLQIPISFSS